MFKIEPENYLKHHGILGQKHGVRNGPPYPLSRSQMSSKEAKKNKVSKFATGQDEEKKESVKKIQNESKKPEEKKETPKQETQKQEQKKVYTNKDIKRIKNTPIDKLSNDEMDFLINRLNLEKRYKEAIAEPNKAKNSKAKNIVNKWLTSFGNNLINDTSKYAAKKLTKTLLADYNEVTKDQEKKKDKD